MKSLLGGWGGGDDKPSTFITEADELTSNN